MVPAIPCGAFDMNFPGPRRLYPATAHPGVAMVLWVGVDDTDSLRGMCTTFLATEFVRELTKDMNLIGHPRLVRLNPNIPWKTRGNGAIAIAVGRGRGSPSVVGQIDGEPIRAYPHGDTGGDPRALLPRLAPLVERWSDLEEAGTDPGLVVLSSKPQPSLYWHAVRGIVAKREANQAIRDRGVSRTWKAGRGIIGAAAACAWRPRDRTWEVLAYREPLRWGTRRFVDAASVRAMDRDFPSTFNNYDPRNERVVIAPRTPCPVLLGIRGDQPEVLPQAFARVYAERADRWLVFLTNQGTDDHVRPMPTSDPWTAGRFRGIVTRGPRTLPGGHVVFGLEAWDVTVYEPAKQFRRIARGLVPGDRVEVIGSVREEPRTINAEKLHVVSVARVLEKVANPRCPRCGDRSKSMGNGAPFRCPHCGARVPRSSATYRVVRRAVRRGWYDPPEGSRRHLSKPLKRGIPS